MRIFLFFQFRKFNFILNVTLREPPTWKIVNEVVSHLSNQSLYDADENASQVHKEFGFVKAYCSEGKIREWNEQKLSVTKRWVEVFQHLDKKGVEYKEIAKIVEYILCLPGSSAPVERVFSSMNRTWTDDKSALQVETLKAILSTKVNLKMSCLDFFHWIKEQPEMLRQIQSSEKYKTRTGDDNQDMQTDPEDEIVITEEETMTID